MKNITVSVDEDTYRLARIRAAERDTSVSALVRQFLIGLASGEAATDRLLNEERELRDRIERFRAADRLAREQLHERS
jgi:plasmid stability protein